jgi:hypothetical protein
LSVLLFMAVFFVASFLTQKIVNWLCYDMHFGTLPSRVEYRALRFCMAQGMYQ